MSSLGSPNPFFIAGKKAYEVERSLRFNDADSAYLRRDTAAGNRRKLTISLWVKRAKLASQQLLVNTGDDGSNQAGLQFLSGDTINFYTGPATGSGNPYFQLVTTAVFRDPSAWYHIVAVYDTENSTQADRTRLYVNGVRITSFGTEQQPSQDYDTFWNQNGKGIALGIYEVNNSNLPFGGYMAEVNFVDGSALDPSYFGQTDVLTGQWNPKKYTGSYGTNGFYLNFSTDTLGTDRSGNGNDFTPNNFSVVAGAGNDSVIDTPTNNFATINPLAAYLTNFEVPSNGNLDFSLAQHEFAMSSFEIPSSGKWYAEVLFTTAASGRIGISNPNRMNEGTGGTQKFNGIDNLGGTIVVDGSTVQTGNLARGDGDITGISVDRDAGTVSFTVNGSASGTAVNISSMNDSSQLVFRVGRNSSSGSAPTGSINFGQRPFSYLPTGYKALNSANLPDPTILLPNKHFEARAYTGTGAGNTQTLTGFQFAPDWVWGKSRTSAYNHGMFDTVRGATNRLWPNLTNAEASNNAITAFTSDGYSVSTDAFNQNSQVTWNWNAGETDSATYTVKVVSDSGNKYRFNDFGTSAVTLDLAEGGTYTFDGSDSSMSGHPFVIGTAANGSVYSTGVTYQLDGASVTYSAYTSGYSSATTRKLIITVPASAPQLYYWCSIHSGMGGAINTNTTLGSSNFDGSIQTTVKANTTAGFSIISYTGTGSDGTLGHGLGVAPSIYIVKRRNSTKDWYVQIGNLSGIDLGRFLKLNSDTGINFASDVFAASADTSTVLNTKSDSATNASGDTYIAYCFSEVAGYSKFGSFSSGSSPFVFTGFRPAWLMAKGTGSGRIWNIYDNKRDPNNAVRRILKAENNGSEVNTADRVDFLSNGFKIRANSGAEPNVSQTYIYFAFAESPFKNSRAR